MPDHLCIICREPFEGPANAKVCQKDSCQRQHMKNYMRSYRRGLRMADMRMSRISEGERSHLNFVKSDCILFQPKAFQALPVRRFAETVNKFLRMRMEDK